MPLGQGQGGVVRLRDVEKERRVAGPRREPGEQPLGEPTGDAVDRAEEEAAGVGGAERDSVGRPGVQPSAAAQSTIVATPAASATPIAIDAPTPRW